MKKFDFNDYKGQNVGMHCKTEEEANEFCRWKHNNGNWWCDGKSYLEETHFDDCGSDTCYMVNRGEYSSFDYYIECGFDVLEMSDFWEVGVVKVLDSGDVIRFEKCDNKNNRKRCRVEKPDQSAWNDKKDDQVNHPSHYTSGDIECIDAIRASMSHEAFCGYLKGNVIKYLWRYQLKVNPVEDLQKADWYLKKLEETEENERTKNDDWR